MLANAARIAIRPQGHGEFQLRIDAPFILEVQAKAVEGDWLARCVGEVVKNVSADPGHEHLVIGKARQRGGDRRVLCQGFRGIVAHVVPAEVYSHLEGVISFGDGEVVDNLPLRYVTALRILEAGRKATGVSRTGAERSHIGTISEGEVAREQSQGRSRIRIAEDRRVIQHRSDKVVHDVRAEKVSVIQLAFILRLYAAVVEYRIYGVRVSRLHTAIELHATKNLVLVAEGVIHASAEQPFFVAVRNGLRIALRARPGGSSTGL